MIDRRSERAEIITEIVLESSAGRRSSRISDMSMGGCYIESITNYRQGEMVTFELKNTVGDVLRFTGNVAYVLDGFGFGLTFTNIGPSHLEFLRSSLPAAARAAPQASTAPEDNILEIW